MNRKTIIIRPRQDGKTTLLIEIANNHAADGKKVIYISRNESESQRIKPKFKYSNISCYSFSIIGGSDHYAKYLDIAKITNYDVVCIDDFNVMKGNTRRKLDALNGLTGDIYLTSTGWELD